MVQYMKTLSKSKLPDVIALQEPFDRAQLPDYVACGSPCECTGKDIKVCTLVKRGKRLAELMDELGLFLLNEPASHTRIGQGACRDTSPDLSIWSDAGAITWSNTFEDLGSNHRVLCVTMGEDKGKMDGCQKSRVMDWDKFREHREREKQEGLIKYIGE
ncbi:hypothetical protein MRX96_006752 [Rhipicephalus microplus]